jgi:hypothetical protein
VLGGGLIVLFVVAVAGVLVLVSAKASLSADSQALASVGMPLGGGKITSVKVVTGPHARPVPVVLKGTQIWPKGLLPAHQVFQIEVVVKRPGWISWLAGSTEKLKLTTTTPSASLRSHFLTLKPGAPLKLQFKDPVRVISYGQPGQLQRHVLASPRADITLPRTAEAGTIAVAAAPRVWETSTPAIISWFPAGASGSAVASPAAGSQIQANTQISLTFSKTVDAALGSSRPPVSPTTPGTWHTVNEHTIVFKPQGFGYGLGANVSIGLPNGIRLVGGQASGTASSGTWTVPQGSPLRMQQLLAELGYLPLKFHSASGPVAPTDEAQIVAATKPPDGGFTWRYQNVPSALHSMWSPGSNGTMTLGALMAFQNDHGLTADGKTTPTLWRALINAAVAGKRSTFGYTFASVNMGSSPITLSVWHNGHVVVTTAVNPGIPSRPTATGTYPVFEHIRSGTMSGTNPDGSHYDDPGIQFISYFNGGDALHAFDRASYGSPQSLGCVEMALGPAGQVWPYTPIGTLVHVA